MISLAHIDLLSLQPHLKHTKDANGIAVVFDQVRRKNVRATPEEIVRQLWIIYFIEKLNLNPKLISVERALEVHGMKRRFDLVIFDKSTKPILLAEFKAPSILLNQMVFDQIAQYNMQMQVPLALVSNGSSHYCFRIDDERRGFEFLDEIPIFP